MKGTLNALTWGGNTASIEVDVMPAKGVNVYEVEVKKQQLQEQTQFTGETAYSFYLQLPSKMNLPGFVIDDEGPF